MPSRSQSRCPGGGDFRSAAAKAFPSRPKRCLACGCPANTASGPVSRHEPALTPVARGSRGRSRDQSQHSGCRDARAPPGCACTTWQRSVSCRGSQTPIRRWWLVLRTASNQHGRSGQAPCGSTRRSTQVLAAELPPEELSRQPCASGRLQACSGSPPLTLVKARVHSLRQPPLHRHPRHCAPYVSVPRSTRTRMPICLPLSCDAA